MQKTILVTGSTDGIGLETAKMLVSLGHNVLLHGRSPVKLEKLAGFETIYWEDHANNIVSSKGILPESQERFLRKIDHAITSHSVTKQEVLVTSPW